MTTPTQDDATNDQPDRRADEGDTPPVAAGDDVRVGPEQSDEPQAGTTEPPD